MDLELFRCVAGATLVGGLQQAATLGRQAGRVELLTEAAAHLLTGLDVGVKQEKEEGGGEAHKSKSVRVKTQQELTWDRDTGCSSW